jgi:ATP-dependent Lhr-like helicase
VTTHRRIPYPNPIPPESFHPAVSRWFQQHFAAATPVQERAWPAIRGGSHTLVTAPTGSGKTLAAFLSVIDDLVRQSLAMELPDETQILYVSPLKALSNDIHKNLQVPLAGSRPSTVTASPIWTAFLSRVWLQAEWSG